MLGFVSASAADDPLDNLTRLQAYEARRESSSNADLARNGDARGIEPGGTLVLGEMAGPGVITHIWTTVGSRDPFYPRSLVLRIYWDGAEKPSVEAPLGDFFGAGFGAMADVQSAPVVASSHGRARSCYWRMPFRKSARVTVTNESTAYKTDSFYHYLDWQKHESLPADTAYFHARYRQETPAAPGLYKILEAAGRGHYVGTVYAVQEMESGWFGEGDDFFTIDGEATPSLRGTGTEDYFGDAWGFRMFCNPHNGVPVWEGYFPGDRVTAYRWHIADPIPFRKSLKVEIEHRGSVFNDFGMQLASFSERSDWVSSVAFWYQDPPVGFEEPIAPVGERLAPYRVLKPGEIVVRADPPAGLTKTADAIAYMPRKPDASIEFEFAVAEKGRYQIAAFMPFGLIGSLYQPFVDGREAGPVIDFCADGMDPLFVRFDLHDLEPGPHVLRFVGRGRSPQQRSKAPAAFSLGMNYLVLLRLEDMAGYHEAMRAGAAKAK